MVQDTSEIKEKILSFLRANGPSLPVHISGEIKSSILFTSAFLSELFSEKKIKMSNMRVGSSPVYFLSGQESQLEKFAEHLKSKEKEAFLLLKEKKFLSDSSQDPAIRVALREIKDFALPFKHGEEIIWKYFLIPESDFKKPEIIEIKKETEKLLEAPKKPKERKKAVRKSKSEQKERFFDRVKEFLSSKSIELKDIESFTKKEIILKAIENGQEKAVVAFNKRRITDSDVIRAHKKISNLGLPYIILSLNEPTKKTSDLIGATKNLSSIHGLK